MESNAYHVNNKPWKAVRKWELKLSKLSVHGADNTQITQIDRNTCNDHVIDQPMMNEWIISDYTGDDNIDDDDRLTVNIAIPLPL